MPEAPRHPREVERLASLRSYQVLDVGADPALDAVTLAAARALGVPAAVVSLVDADRQWFLAATGLADVLGYDTRETSREVSFCAHAIARDIPAPGDGAGADPAGQVVAQQAPLVVPDATADQRFADNPWVTGPEQVRFYAGAPLIGRDGLALGALCVLDNEPRDLDEGGTRVLTELAGTVAELLELRRIEAGAGLSGHDVLAESHRLRAGIDAGEMVVHYQPVVDLVSRRVISVEALVRWQHPERGLLPPAAFLPVAEASGLIVPLGRHVLQVACAQLARWRREIPAAAQLSVAVNLSGRQLSEPDVHEVVAEALTLSALPADALIVELTETCLAGDQQEVDIALQRIRDLGVHLSLDDFGTGYASFSYLQRFHPGAVKIDRCFVAALGRSVRDDLLARSLIDLGLDLGCYIVAEGIEHPEQVQALMTMGVRYGQGYHFSTPRAPQDLHALLQQAPEPQLTGS